MTAVILESLAIEGLILLNGLFSMSEMAVVAARKARLQQWANDGASRARTALDLAGSPEWFLSTVQIGITLIGILAGAFGGWRVFEWRGLRFEVLDMDGKRVDKVLVTPALSESGGPSDAQDDERRREKPS